VYKEQGLKFLDALDEKLKKYHFLDFLDSKHIKRAHAVLGAGVFLVLFVLFGFGASPLCNLIGFVYPVYASFKALKSESKDDDSQWLTYWVVYGFFTLIESLSDVLLFWIPFYYLLKIIFLIWCFLPATKGATFLFKKFIEPALSKYEKDLDGVKESVQKAAKDFSGLGGDDKKSAAADGDDSGKSAKKEK